MSLLIEGLELGRDEGTDDGASLLSVGLELGSSDLISVGRFDGIKLGPSDLIAEGEEEGILEFIKLGPSDLTIEGVIEASTLGVVENFMLGKSEGKAEG